MENDYGIEEAFKLSHNADTKFIFIAPNTNFGGDINVYENKPRRNEKIRKYEVVSGKFIEDDYEFPEMFYFFYFGDYKLKVAFEYGDEDDNSPNMNMILVSYKKVDKKEYYDDYSSVYYIYKRGNEYYNDEYTIEHKMRYVGRIGKRTLELMGLDIDDINKNGIYLEMHHKNVQEGLPPCGRDLIENIDGDFLQALDYGTLFVNRNGTEFLMSHHHPYKKNNFGNWDTSKFKDCTHKLKKGTIKNILGRELKLADDPVLIINYKDKFHEYTQFHYYKW